MNRFSSSSQVRLLAAALALALAAATVPARAQSSSAVYPAKGQSARQQDKDKYECYAWARRQSGFDPAQSTTQLTLTSQPPGALLRGAVGGAALGELASNDAGHGAAVGVLGAAVRQRVKQQQAQAAHAQQRAGYERAFGACLEGRGYTVK